MFPLTFHPMFQQKGVWLCQKFDLTVCGRVEVSSLCLEDSCLSLRSTLSKQLEVPKDFWTRSLNFDGNKITKLPPAGSPILREAHNLDFPEHVGNGRFEVTAFRVQYLDRACPFPWLQPCGAPVGSGLQPEHSLSSYLLTLQCCSVLTFEAAPLLGTNNESQPHHGNLCWGEKTGADQSLCNPRIPQQLRVP